MRVSLATGPASWGVDFAENPANPPWEQVLDETSEAGFQWTELGPLGYMPEDGYRLGWELRSRGLSVPGAVIFEPLHDSRHRGETLAVAERTCSLVKAVNARYLVIIDRVSEARSRTPGRSDDAPRLTRRSWLEMVDTIKRVASMAQEVFDLRAVVHSHAGTYIEFADELESLLGTVPAEDLGVCIDTGHFAFAGIDAAAFARRHGDRVEYLHLKDLDPTVHDRVVARKLDYWTAVKAGVFCPLGSGVVRLEALRRSLPSYEGHATIEQDKDPTTSSNVVADLKASMKVARNVLDRSDPSSD